VRLAEHKQKGDDEKLFAEVIVHVQDPAAPIFEVSGRREGSYDAGRVIAGFDEVIYHRAASIDQDLLCVGAMEINLCHAQSPSSVRQLGSTAALRCQQVVKGIDLGIEHGEISLVLDAFCSGLPQGHRLIK
jgi:hypothetical protein